MERSSHTSLKVSTASIVLETARIIISINMIMSPIPLTPLLLFYVM
nr:MAG TPA: hypothetical protein [Caudoviricetes sp.]